MMNWVKIKRNSNYSINKDGQIRNDNTGKIKTQYINPENGYYTVDLYENNTSHKVTVHRLIAEAFIPNPDNKPCIDHIDGNRQNNSISNLRWATYSENNSRFGTHGVRSEKIVVTHYREKLKKRNRTHEAWLEPDCIRYFDSITDVAEYFGVTISNISLLLKKRTIGKRGVTRGYLFQYKREL